MKARLFMRKTIADRENRTPYFGWKPNGLPLTYIREIYERFYLYGRKTVEPATPSGQASAMTD